MTDNIYSHPEYVGLFASACEALHEPWRQNVVQDWLLDHGASEAIAGEAVLRRAIGIWDIWDFDDSRGSGRGSGSVINSGSGIYKVRQMRIGHAYLIHCGDWHTFCGRVVEQTGPGTYELESVSKISETNNGDCWHALAAGDERLRKAATYQHYTTKAVIPLVIVAFEWVGALPQEEA